MSALELVISTYKGTNIEAETTVGMHNLHSFSELDCNCVDCGDDSDCSTPW